MGGQDVPDGGGLSAGGGLAADGDVRAKVVELRQLVEQARSMPMSASCVVNRTELLAHLDELSFLLTNTLSDADRVRADSAAVVAQGRDEATELVAQARIEREALVSESEIHEVAQREADRLLADAREEAEGLRKETDDYVDGRLASFEITLQRIIEAVARGRERLRSRSSLGELSEADLAGPPLPDPSAD
ncbi:MAG: hypothetical protein ACR2KL_13260 [Nocardioidaceae bacterium]